MAKEYTFLQATVIECANCKYWKQRSNREYGLCGKHSGVWRNLDYCSKGEHKDGGQNNGMDIGV